MNIVDQLAQRQLRTDLPDLRPGDTVRVHTKVKEGDKERIQIYEGVIIAMRGSDMNATLTVRKVSFGVGVERIFPMHSPNVEKFEIKQRGKVRRAKLYYLRELSGRSARIAEDKNFVEAGADVATVETSEAAPRVSNGE